MLIMTRRTMSKRSMHDDSHQNNKFKHSNKRASIVKWALISRLTLLILQFISNVLITDHNAGVFIYPKDKETLTNFDRLVDTFFGGFVRWDAQYFVHVAKYGYTYENTLAFFPLYPMLVGHISTVMSYFLPFVHLDSIITTTFLFANIFFFVKAALSLFSLTSTIKNVEFAYRSTILFCFNPASIFFSAPYTESLFCYLTFRSIHASVTMATNHCKHSHFKYADVLCSVTYIALSTCTRSNGILNVGFFVYFYLRSTFESQINFTHVAYRLLSLSLCVGLCIVPFVAVQIYDYVHFCTNFHHDLPNFLVEFAKENDLVLPGSFVAQNQSWCYANFPLAYSYVQEHYWNVGFLKYYELKQLPNFLLAVPVIFIIFVNVFDFVKERKYMFLHLGIFRRFVGCNKSELNDLKRLSKMHVDLFFVCTVHVFILSMVCLLFVHVQVATRMIYSASPIVYWFSCEHLRNSFHRKCLLCFHTCYFVVGTLMFCNFLPWT